MGNAIKFDFNHMMADVLGEHGIKRSQVEALAAQATAAFDGVKAHRGTGMMGWTELPYNQDDIVEELLKAAADIRGEFEYFVVLGIGGSALGPIAIQQALNHLHYNELPDAKRNGPKFYVEDNIDPERMYALFDVIDIKKTCFNVITKSGKTAETMSQYLIVLDALKAAIGDDYAKHIVATTSSNSGNLIQIAKRENFRTFYIPDGVGGRFSEMCPVGLLAAAVCGIDIKAMLKGAADMDARCASSDMWKNPALFDAALMYIAMQEQGANISVMLPYADSLKTMADWYCQLWAESLGKNVTRDGKPCHAGSTPTKALGVTDQHSQLQLYTEGPFDKVVTFLAVENFHKHQPIPEGCEYNADVHFLCGKSMNQLIAAELKGTEYALFRSGRMSQKIIIDEVNANTVGQLLYFFELVTAYAGELLNIDAFNQPGVEESKIASYAVLGHSDKKYADKKAEMEGAPKDLPEYIL